MIICLLLDSNDIRRHLSSSYSTKLGCCHHTATVPEDKYEKFPTNCLKSQSLPNKELLKASFFDI